MKKLFDNIRKHYIIYFLIIIIISIVGAWISIKFEDSDWIPEIIEGAGASLLIFVPKSIRNIIKAFINAIAGYSDITSSQNMNIFDDSDDENLFDDMEDNDEKPSKKD